MNCCEIYHRIKETGKEVVIWERDSYAICKELYDYLLYRGVMVQFLISSQSSKWACGEGERHFQDIPVLAEDEVTVLDKNQYLFIQTFGSDREDTDNILYVPEIKRLPEINSYIDKIGNEIKSGERKEAVTVLFSGSDNRVTVGNNVRIGNNVRFELHNGSAISIGDNCVIGNDVKLIAYENSIISVNKFSKIGNNVEISSRYDSNVYLGAEVLLADDCLVFNKYASLIDIGTGSTFERNTHIISTSESKIEIGKNCMFSYDTAVICNDGHAIFDYESKVRKNRNRAISVGEHVWCGIKSTLLSGCMIGNGSIVGANAVVNKKFEEQNISIVGNPAVKGGKKLFWERYYL